MLQVIHLVSDTVLSVLIILNLIVKTKKNDN